LCGKFENTNSKTLEDVHLASDGNILDICFCETNNLFGYASTDTLCYIRKFSPIGTKMVLETVLQGHKSEVNCIKWISSINNWITGGEDCTIRLWVLKLRLFVLKLNEI
jgi:WD40 repeat protein